jgi:hypothetical protein
MNHVGGQYFGKTNSVRLACSMFLPLIRKLLRVALMRLQLRPRPLSSCDAPFPANTLSIWMIEKSELLVSDVRRN